MASLLYTGTALGPETYLTNPVPRPSKGVRLFLDITAEVGAGSLDAKVQVKNPVSGEYIDLPGASFPTQTGVGSAMLTVYPELTTVTANVAVAAYLGGPWRVSITEAGVGSTMTFTVGYIPLG